MRKLLVLLVALVTVAAFAAVNFSGRLDVTPKLTYTATPTSMSFSVGVAGALYIEASNEDQTTGFYVSISPTVTTSTPPAFSWSYWGYVWQKLYTSDSFTVTLQAGNLERGWSSASGANFSWLITTPSFTAYSDDAAVGLKFDISSGDLSDSLSVFVTPDATKIVNVDVFNSLSFGFLSTGILVQDLLNATSGLPPFSLSASVDLAKALAIQGATLKGFGYFTINPAGSPILQKYLVGADVGIEKLSASVAFDNNNQLGIAVKTTALAPVTVGADVVIPNITSITNFLLAGYASWKTGLIGHRLALSWDGTIATVAWRMRVTF
ncbi:hypothetical protein AJ81_02555 [Pseudothermotoga hypogea DSM 11164 = NBRC 106472]|uniref:Uncharacterized protein n=1 Tax=Pseudothermotoga hypogea DSM 11164 = NBRC 106472 TaxID=1123384 RepID=A0A0X1KTR0_9THEM|nr:hypothetical protein [Pseudothermotoga hypogea]AJC74659.1 hypothetical protein AJ81_02555 [Pseudothermotoga hypogea DSM 11164 = NBRC 106472]